MENLTSIVAVSSSEDKLLKLDASFVHENGESERNQNTEPLPSGSCSELVTTSLTVINFLMFLFLIFFDC